MRGREERKELQEGGNAKSGAKRQERQPWMNGGGGGKWVPRVHDDSLLLSFDSSLTKELNQRHWP